MKRREPHGFQHWALQVLGVAVAYAVTGKLGLLLAIPPGYATLIWPPSGIALAGVLLYGYRVWPGVLLGSFLVNVWTGFDASSLSSFLVPLGIGSGAALQAVVGSFLIRRYAGFPNPLANEREVFSFLGWGAASCIVNAVIGVFVLFAAGKIPATSFIINSATWWIGDAVGVFIFAPLVLVWLLEPREIWLARRLTVTISLAATFVLTIIIVAFGTSWERERLKLRFEQHATVLGAALEKRLDSYMGVLRSLSSFHVASQHIDRNEFRAFVVQPLKDFPGIQALSWNPVVPNAGRVEFERAIQDEGFSGFQITERNDDGRLVRAAERPYYVSVRYLEPFKGNEKAFGYDVASTPTRLEALNAARDSGQPIVTGRIKLIQETGDQFGVLVFMPIYRNGLPHNTIEQRRANLEGYMVGVLRGGDILNAFMAEIEEEGVVHRLLDETAPPGERLLFECEHADDIEQGALDEERLFGGSTPLGRSVSIPFGGRQWRFEVSANQQYLARYRPENTWLIFLAGLLITSMVGAFVMVASGRSTVLRGMVEERTRDLQASEDRLVAAQKIAKVGNWDWSVVTNELWWSDEIYRIFGVDPGKFDATFEAFLNTVHPDDREYVNNTVNEALSQNKSYSIDHRIALPNGSLKFVHEEGEVVRDEQGEPIRIIGTVQDISIRKIFETEITRLKNRTELILESAGDGIYGLNTKGHTTFVNKVAAKLVGWDAEDLIGKNQHEILHHTKPDGSPYPREECPIYAAFLDGKVHTVTDDVFWRKDGSSFPVEYTSTPIEEDGEITGAVVVFRDVTEQRKAELLNTRLGRIVEQSVNEVYVFDAETLKFTTVNQGARENLGYSMADLLTMTPLDLKPEFTPEQFGKLIIPLRNGSKKQTVFRTVHKRKDKTLYDVEVRLQFFHREQPPVFVAISEDITERKQAEAELLKLSTAVEQSPASVVITDPAGNIQYVNHKFTEVTGYILDEAIGENPRILQSGETPIEQYQELWGTILAGEVWHGEFHNKRKDGSLYWESASIAPIKNASGEITNFVAVKEDITARKETEKALAESNQELQSFVYIISHDLREPLRTISSFIEILQERFGDDLDEEVAEFMGYVVEGSDRMAMMIRDLVAFSRVGSSDKELEPLNAADVVQSAIDNLIIATEEADADIVVTDALPVVIGDESQLTRLFQNLIGNAIKYRAPDRSPVVHVDLAKDAQEWVFSVKDNGIGIEERFFEKIFGVFERLHARDEFEGTGIGLAVCRKIVERHGGRMWVESAPDEGSTFFFSLPVETKR